MRILAILAAKLEDLPRFLDQRGKVQIDPQSVNFKNGFIQFFSRTLSLGLILSYNFDHILFGRKIGILAEKSKQRQFCFANITMKKTSSEKMKYTMTKLTENATK